MNLALSSYRTLVFLGTFLPCYAPNVHVDVVEAAIEEYLAKITSHNRKRLRIDTFYSPNQQGVVNPHAEEFWRGLADRNGGTYTLIEEQP